MPRRPNIVFIMPDEWRHDAFGFAGNPVVETPNIDALAARGASFRASHCESPVCQPSRASLATGLYPRQHKLFDNSHLPWAEGNDFPSPERFRMFMHRLQDAGYYTAEIGKMHFGAPEGRRPRRPDRRPRNILEFLTSARGDLRERAPWVEKHGFHESHEEPDKYILIGSQSEYTEYLRERGALETFRDHLVESMKQPGAVGGASAARPEPLDPFDTLDSYVGQRACRFIREYERDEPFFLWVTPIGPHAPLDAPRYWSDRYEPEDIPLGPLQLPEFPDNPWGRFLEWNLNHLRCRDYTKEDWQHLGALYYGLCTQIDHQVGEIVRTIEEAGIEGETWIFFSSDHGELLGDHGYVSKRLFYRSSVLVPSIIVPPGGLDSPVVVDGPTQHTDLVGSMLALADADADGYCGRSLLGALEGQEVSREAAFSEIAEFTAVSTRRYLLIVHRDTLEPQALYDRDLDPDEMRNIVDDASHRQTVEELLERYVEPFVAERGEA